MPEIKQWKYCWYLVCLLFFFHYICFIDSENLYFIPVLKDKITRFWLLTWFISLILKFLSNYGHPLISAVPNRTYGIHAFYKILWSFNFKYVFLILIRINFDWACEIFFLNFLLTTYHHIKIRVTVTELRNENEQNAIRNILPHYTVESL